MSQLGSEFAVVCLPIGEYRDPANPTLPADEEAEQVTELLDQLGGRPEPWQLPPRDRHRTNVDARLDVWSGTTRARSSLMYWVGHGSSDGDSAHLATYDSGADNGMTPEDLARRIRTEWGYRTTEEGTWALVAIEACGAKRFVERLNSVLHDRPNVPSRLGLIGAGGEGTAHLGEFRAALGGALRSYDINDEEIRLEDLVSRIRGRLAEGKVLDLDLHLARPVPRRRLVEGTITAPLDVRTQLAEFLAGLTPDERGHFIPKAQGAEQGELAWYFVGRAAERASIVSWLRSGASGMLVVTGRAGAGKSALLGNVVVHANPELRDLLAKAEVLAPLRPSDRPPDRVFDAVVHLSGMTMDEVVRTLTAAAGLPSSEAAAPGQELEALVTGIGDRPFCLLADALDEAQDPLSIASAVLRRLAALPHGRVVVGTRRSTKERPDRPNVDDEDLLDALGRAASTATVVVDRDPEAVAAYVRTRLRAALALDETTLDRIVGLVGEQERQFLFARLAVHEIIARPFLAEPANAQELAQMLRGDHRQLFSAAVRRLTATRPANLALLQALALGQGRGLPRADQVWATAASALLDRDPVTEVDIDDLLDQAAPYIMLDADHGQSVYRPAHQTFREYFLARPGVIASQRLIAAALIAAAEPALPASLNPYLVSHLSAHVAAGESWPDIAATDLLDHLDPVAVAADAFRTAGDSLPAEISAIISANHLLAPLPPEERSGTRQLIAGRHAGTRSYESTTASWSVRWSRLRPDAPHIVLSGHRSEVIATASVPIADGRVLLASADKGGMILLWDPATATPAGRPILTGDTVTALVAVPRPGRQTILAVGTDTTGTQLWDPVTGAQLGSVLDEPTDKVSALAVVPMPDGRTVLATAADGDSAVRFWDLETTSETGALATDHVRGLNMLAPVPWSGERTLLATGSHDGTVRLWDPATGERVGQVASYIRDATSVVPLPRSTGTPLLAIASDGSARRWDPLTDERTGIEWLEGEYVTPRVLVGLPAVSGPPLLAGADGGIWHSESGELVGRLNGIGWTFTITALPLPDGRTLLATGGDAVRLWDPTAGLATATETEVTAIATSADGKALATGDKEGTAQLWDAGSGTPLGAPMLGHWREIYDLTFLPDRGQLATGGQDGSIRLWDHRSTTLAEEWVANHGGWVGSLAAAELPDGRTRLASIGLDNRLRIWDPATGRQIGFPKFFLLQMPHVTAVAVAGGRTLLAIHGDGPVVRLLDPARGRAARRRAQRVRLHHGKDQWVHAITSVELRDGRVLLAGAGSQRMLRLWDTATWRPFGEPLTGHTEYWVNTVAAVRRPGDSGQLLASGGDDGTVRIWDPETGALLLTIVIGETVKQLAPLGTGLLVRLESGLVALDLNPNSLNTPRSPNPPGSVG